MNDILGLNTLNEKGVNVNVKVELTSQTLLQLFIVAISAALGIMVINYLMGNLNK